MANIESVIATTTKTSTGFPVYALVGPEYQYKQQIILYQIVDIQQLRYLSGQSAGQATARVSFACMSMDLLQAETMAEAVRNLWHGFAGTIDGVVIQAVWAVDEPVTDEYRQEGTEGVVFSVDFEFMFRFRN